MINSAGGHDLINPRYLRGWHNWISVVLLLAAAGDASAGIRPSFQLDPSAWDATDVVMVKTTTEADTFEVIESWKGDLQPAQRITIPELRPGADGVPISSYPAEEWPAHSDDSTSAKIPKQVPGSRLVLFLKKRNQAGSSLDANGQGMHPDWEPANLFHDMKTAAVWIDGETLYCFVQIVNPGPSVLVKFSSFEWSRTRSKWEETAMTIASLRTRADHVVQIQRELRTAVQIEDVVARAEQLRTFARSGVGPAQSFVFEELGKAGPAALPVLRAMLEDPEYAELRELLMHAYVRAGGAALGEELSARLESELAFWKAMGPSLARGWWNEDARPNAPLRERYFETLEILHGLAGSRPLSAVNTAIELRDFWRSLPQLNDPSGLDQMAGECDRLIHLIRSK